MRYVIAEPCTGVTDKACAGECPAGCINEGERMLYIHPGECVDRGGCEPVCPAGAIFLRRRRARPVGPAHRRKRQILRPARLARRCRQDRPRRPTTPTTPPATSPAGNPTMSLRQIPERGRASGGPAPSSPGARATQAAKR
jgi:NAD-dependent dihydropyrimidine dehydrogenase PreA subunit